MRITMVIASMAAGGAERVMSLLANHWAQKGWQISLITFDAADGDFFTLDGRINRVALGLMGNATSLISAVSGNLQRIRALRKAIRATQPELVLSFMDRTNVLTLLACRGLDMPVVVSERSNPIRQPAGAVFSWLRQSLYPQAAAVVVNSPEAGQYLGRWVSAQRLCYLPNPLLNPEDMPDANEIKGAKPDQHSVIGLGRFTAEKGFDLLIKAFARTAAAHPAWRLFLLGQGPEQPALSELAQGLGIGLKVIFCGQVANPAAYLSRAGLFVLPSRHEGFPNGLAEAMASGLACVATDCSQSVKDMLADENHAYVTPIEDSGALAEAISNLLSDAELRQRLGALNRQASVRFSLSRVARRWEELFRLIV